MLGFSVCIGGCLLALFIYSGLDFFNCKGPNGQVDLLWPVSPHLLQRPFTPFLLILFALLLDVSPASFLPDF
ncbi:hypothetical protein GYH30_052476 [Glycine max]|nr:hypothetical protein GYH30_052476 [Glycine max]